MDSLPVEIFDQIVETLTFTEVLKLRLVSKSWENMVASFNSQKIKSLVLFTEDYFRTGLWSCLASTSNRFFGAVKIQSFRKIALPSTTVLTKDLTQKILKLFPNIEQLVFKAPILDLSAAKNFTHLLTRWNNISTVSLEANAYLDELRISIADAINGLRGLIRLDLNSNLDISLLSQTLARLFVGGMLEERNLLEVIRQIGPSCTRLWIRPYQMCIDEPRLRISNVQSWMRANVKLFSRLTRFGCTSYIENEGLKFIDTHFISLRVWYIISTDAHGTFAEMGLVCRLHELRVLNACGFTPIIGAPGTDVTEPMRNVNFFEFHWGYVWDMDTTIAFCTKLAWLLPNVEHIVLVFNTYLNYDGDHVYLFKIIEEKLPLFKNLRKCQLRMLVDYDFEGDDECTAHLGERMCTYDLLFDLIWIKNIEMQYKYPY